MVAPLAVFPFFFFKSWDICLMNVQVLIMNCYTVYYLVDADAYAA